MNILQQLQTPGNTSRINIDSDEIVTAAHENELVAIVRAAVGRTFSYYRLNKEDKSQLWDEATQEALTGAYGQLGRTVKAVYQAAGWAAMRYLHQMTNNYDGLYNGARIHESYEVMAEAMHDDDFTYIEAMKHGRVLKRPTESEAIYNIEREATTWQGARSHWEQLEAQAVMELAAATYDASAAGDSLWSKVEGDLFGAFCEMREVHKLKPLSVYARVIVQRTRNVTHEEIAAELGIDDPFQYMNTVSDAFNALEEIAQMSAEERTARMQLNHGLVLHHTQLEQDMSPLLNDAHSKHIILFPFGGVTVYKKMSEGKTPRLVGKFHMKYAPNGDWSKPKGVSKTTPPLATLTYSQLRETALQFIEKVRTAGGNEIAREFFGPAVIQALLNA